MFKEWEYVYNAGKEGFYMLGLRENRNRFLKDENSRQDLYNNPQLSY